MNPSFKIAKSAAVVSILTLTFTLNATGSEADNTCLLSKVETHAESVIDPCTKIISDASVAPKDRGYALFVRGKGYHNTKRFVLARQDYDAAIKLTPENDDIYPSRANIAFRAGRYDEGVAFLEQALKLNPKNTNAIRSIGALLSSSGDTEQASSYFSQVIDLKPDDAYALLWRSEIYKQKQQFELALKDADTLVALPPVEVNRQGYLDGNGNRLDFHIIALKNRAEIYSAAGKSDLAEKDLTQAVDYKLSAQSLAARGKFFAYVKGREQDALRDLDGAVSLDPSDYNSFYSKGLVHLRLRQADGALSSFDRAVEINPRFAHALRMRARTHRELDHTERAIEDMNRAVELSPQILRETMYGLRSAGYWRSNDNPRSITPALQDALRACMLDRTCN